MRDLIEGIMQLRRSTDDVDCGSEDSLEAHITEEDVKRSIDALRPLGCGYEVFSLHGKTMVRTVPQELSGDAMSILLHLSSDTSQKDGQNLPFMTAQDTQRLSASTMKDWTPARAQQALDDMVMGDGTMWLDVVPADEDAGPELRRRRYYSLTFSEPFLTQRSPDAISSMEALRV
ncbi:hypothetical protein MOBT1_001772 [Malassezia obtusa]|uniref:Uncharacterized protein n=1 Tax=Malassezia obtusa TaxID=76774 RepID=A0AAF0DYU2_9BASI|nr:hypothetical protein MOBT1_001772 [Malassezia obtusa]